MLLAPSGVACIADVDVTFTVGSQLLATDSIGDLLRVLCHSLANADLFVHHRLFFNFDLFLSDWHADCLVRGGLDWRISRAPLDRASFDEHFLACHRNVHRALLFDDVFAELHTPRLD
jgi:hypothetical protein